MHKTLFQETGWSFVTAAGGEVDVGLSKFLYVAAEVGAFYVKRNHESAIWRLPCAALGAGVGLGVSAGGPVTLSISLPFPASRSFSIYRNPARSLSSFGLGSFIGAFVAVSGGVNLGLGAGASVVFFGAPERLVGLVTAAAGPVGIPARVNATMLACQGAGVLWGTQQTSAAGVGTTILAGSIVTAMRAAPGETG